MGDLSHSSITASKREHGTISIKSRHTKGDRREMPSHNVNQSVGPQDMSWKIMEKNVEVLQLQVVVVVRCKRTTMMAISWTEKIVSFFPSTQEKKVDSF